MATHNAFWPEKRSDTPSSLPDRIRKRNRQGEKIQLFCVDPRAVPYLGVSRQGSNPHSRLGQFFEIENCSRFDLTRIDISPIRESSISNHQNHTISRDFDRAIIQILYDFDESAKYV